LKSRSALETLDRALMLARAQPLRELGRAWLPGALLAWLLICLYDFERVEGVRTLRPLFALLLVAGFALRAVVLARWAGRLADGELAQSGVRAQPAKVASLLRASFWVGADLWFWLWPLMVVLHVDPWLTPLLLPVWCVRGAIAPSWLAVANASGEGSGFGVLRAALAHCEGQRGQAFACELLLLLGVLASILNVGAALVLLVSLGQSALGLDLASVRAFVSPQNHFVLLCVSAFGLVLVEPLRAALASVLYVDAELVREGAAARTAVARALASTQRAGARGRSHDGPLRAGLSVLLCLWIAAGHARAQAPAPAALHEDTTTDTSKVTPEQACDEVCLRAQERDATVEDRVRAILSEPEFREFPDEAWGIDGKGSLRRWLEKWFDDWFKRASSPETPDARARSRWGDVPGAKLFLTLAVVLLMIALAKLTFGVGPRRTTRAPERGPAKEPDPFTRSSADHFADAERLFAQSPRAALRALYLGSLVGLARQDLVQLAPERTNGHYLRQLSGRSQRAPFGELTRTFDAVQYGGLALDQAAFQRCLSLARALVVAPAQAPAAEATR